MSKRGDGNVEIKISKRDFFNPLVIGFEYNASLEVLQWVNDTLNMYPDKLAVLFTHEYMGDNGERLARGEHAFDAVVQYHDNIMMVLSGHVNNSALSYGSTGYRKDNNTHQLLANYQGMEMSGTLRWYECYPNVGKVFVRTYSPLWDRWMISRNNSFIFDYDFKGE